VSGEEPSEAHLSAEQPPPGPTPRLPAPHVQQGRSPHREGAPPQGPSAPVRVIGRLRRREDFDRLKVGARRFRSGPISVLYSPDAELATPLVAFGIGRAVGPAVVRNRLRRRLREALRQVPSDPPAGRYLIRVTPAAARLDWDGVWRHVERVVGTVRAEAVA
jgi:ribonuclease P protein component